LKTKNKKAQTKRTLKEKKPRILFSFSISLSI